MGITVKYKYDEKLFRSTLEMQVKERSQSAYLLMMVLSLHPLDQVQSLQH